MRLDLFLKQTGLVKRRPVAKLLCDGGKISRNAQLAKASDDVRAGDILKLDFGTRRVEVEIVSVPAGSVPKAARTDHFRLTSEEKIEDDWI